MSQDTSAYGVDVKYKTEFYNGMPVKTRMAELCEALSQFGIWVRLHYVYPYPHVNEIIPLMAEGKIRPVLSEAMDFDGVPEAHARYATLSRTAPHIVASVSVIAGIRWNIWTVHAMHRRISA